MELCDPWTSAPLRISGCTVYTMKDFVLPVLAKVSADWSRRVVHGALFMSRTGKSEKPQENKALQKTASQKLRSPELGISQQQVKTARNSEKLQKFGRNLFLKEVYTTVGTVLLSFFWVQVLYCVHHSFQTYGVYPFPLISEEHGIHHSHFRSVTSGSDDSGEKASLGNI